MESKTPVEIERQEVASSDNVTCIVFELVEGRLLTK